jgi:protein-S-isoprenylcysteine O-methyltransferase Ste14
MSNASAVGPHVPSVEARLSPAKRLLQIIASFVWWIGALFVGAGRLTWIRGWISVALWVTGMTTIGIIGNHYNPSVMDARAQWRHKDTKRFDKIFLAAYFPLVLIQPAVAGLDVVRFRWSSMPFGFVYVGAIAFILSMVLIGWVLCVNPFAEATVRIQTDRGHTVVMSGPYRVVRHPMYVGSALLFLGTPLVWGSVWALIVGMATVVLMIWRTSREDQTLRQELAGYEQYATVTRYRLLPGVW